MSGPAPKPVALKVLEGNRGHRPLDLSSVFRPEVGVPTMPKRLAPEARKAWRRLSTELVRYNLLSVVHADAFAMLCRTIGRVEVLERAIEAKQALAVADGKDASEALVELTPKGMRIQSVHYTMLNREMDKLRSLIAEFGLTPAQQARVTTAVRAQAQLFPIEGGAPAEPAEPATPAGFADFN